MTSDRLKTVLHAQPFRPFRLHLADGRELIVQHPDFLSQSPGSRTVIVFTGDEYFEIVDLLLVASIAIGNGKGSHRRRK